MWKKTKTIRRFEIHQFIRLQRQQQRHSVACPPRSTNMGKPRGIRCARKLRVHRKEALWADKEKKVWELLYCVSLLLFCTFGKGLLSRFCGRRTTRRPIWVPSTSAILSEALQSLQQKCFEVVGFGFWLVRTNIPFCRYLSCEGHCGGEDWHWSKAVACLALTLSCGHVLVEFPYVWSSNGCLWLRPNSAIRKCCRWELKSCLTGHTLLALLAACTPLYLLHLLHGMVRCPADQEWQEDCSIRAKVGCHHAASCSQPLHHGMSSVSSEWAEAVD